jgi:hypothetical protein
MASKIIEVSRYRVAKDRLGFYVIMLFPFDPILLSVGNNAVPTPVEGLPAVLTTHGKLEQPELDAITAGEMIWKLVGPIKQHEGEGLAELRARAQRLYAGLLVTFVEEKTLMYATAGQRHNEG